MVGLVGPYFPLVLARMSRLLPREAPSLTLRTLIIAQGTLAACHLGMGYLATTFGMAVAYPYAGGEFNHSDPLSTTLNHLP